MSANSKKYNLAYYYSNQRAIVECECGRSYMSCNKYRHIKTRIHVKHLAKVEELNHIESDTEKEV
jgi:acetone carboxylase gamma subunit